MLKRDLFGRLVEPQYCDMRRLVLARIASGQLTEDSDLSKVLDSLELVLAAGADVHALDGRGLTPAQKALGDECVIYLFRGGKIADKPGTCQPPKRE